MNPSVGEGSEVAEPRQKIRIFSVALIYSRACGFLASSGGGHAGSIRGIAQQQGCVHVTSTAYTHPFMTEVVICIRFSPHIKGAALHPVQAVFLHTEFR